MSTDKDQASPEPPKPDWLRETFKDYKLPNTQAAE